MEYQDFTIEVRSAEGGRFEAKVIAAPIDEAPSIFFSEPIAKDALQDLLGAYDRPGSEIGKERPTPEVSPRGLGEQLHSALFRDEMADLFLRCRDAVLSDGQSGLRLRLRFGIDDLEAPYLAALPWEWLWDPRSAGFLAIDLCTPVVRDLAAARPHGSLHVVPPLRILVVDAAPGAMKMLNLKLETQRMTEALGFLIDAGQVELLRLKKTTPDELRDVLRDEEIHVLHFMGHGGYNSGSGNGAIFFAKDDGTKDQVDGEMLSAYLMRISSLRLVVLNACKTARHAGWRGGPANYGAAAAVAVRTKVPAVIANQYSISDSSAIAFSEAFYGRLAAGDGVDTALTEARLRLKARTSEWATPVLFLTARDGKVFDMEPVRRERTIRVARSQPETAVRLGVRSFVGWGRDMEDRNDAVLDLVKLFKERSIKKEEWWQEKVFPKLRTFLLENVDERRPLLLDFAAHSSIAFAAGWVLEPKSGLDVRVRQRTGNEGEFEWHPRDGKDAEGDLWLARPDIELGAGAPDVAVALSVSQPDVAADVQEFIRLQACPIGRIVDAVIAPGPGPGSVRGGAHALRLAHALLPSLRRKRPHEREGRVHFFCSAPNALVFYLGQLSSSLPGTVLYEFPFRSPGSYGQYRKSIELPPPGNVAKTRRG